MSPQQHVPEVSFFTNCYENDWERVLKENRLQIIIERCNMAFFEKVLIINNVKDRALVEQYAKAAVDKKIIDAYYFSEDYSEAILFAFSVTRESFYLDFHDGYWYSIGPMAAIYLCKGKYLLYFTCDCMIFEGASSEWIIDAVNIMEKDRSILSANPLDSGIVTTDYVVGEDDKFFYSTIFSDHCFLIERDRFYGDIYNEYHYFSERYFVYTGELFEKRIGSYMACNNLFRIVRKDVGYSHVKLLNEGLEQQYSNPGFKKKARLFAATWSRRIRKAINRRILGHTKHRDNKIRRFHL